MNTYVQSNENERYNPSLAVAGLVASVRQSLQPMFVTNKTQLEEINEHLSETENGLLVITIEQGNARGESIVEHIGKRFSSARMVLVCETAGNDLLRLAFMNGVQAAVGRQSSVETLRAAIDEVVRGNRFIAPELIRPQTTTVSAFMERQIAQREATPMTTPSSANAGVELTRREKQVLGLIAQGKPRRAIAEMLKVSPRTIDAYRARLLQKLNLDSSVQLVKYAYGVGIIN
jgi:DNA-binding NarL/FixJ family response regulator